MSKKRKTTPLRHLFQMSGCFCFFALSFAILVSLTLSVYRLQSDNPLTLEQNFKSRSERAARMAERMDSQYPVLQPGVALIASGLCAILFGREVVLAARAYREDRRRRTLRAAAA